MGQNLATTVAKSAAGNLVFLATDGAGQAGGNLAVTVKGGSVTQAPDGYVTIAASGNTALGGNAAAGDVLTSLVITPDVVGAGNVTIEDGGTLIPVFVNGGNLSSTAPITVTFGNGVPSKNGGWRVVTGASVTVIATGRFTR